MQCMQVKLQFSCLLLHLTLIVKDKISMPILPTSMPATSLTNWANWSRSWYTSSTVKVAVEERENKTSHHDHYEREKEEEEEFMLPKRNL